MPHKMLVMDGPGWGVYKRNQIAKSPRGGVQYWQERVDQAKATQHPLSLCILMYEDGTLGEETESILRKLKR